MSAVTSNNEIRAVLPKSSATRQGFRESFAEWRKSPQINKKAYEVIQRRTISYLQGEVVVNVETSHFEYS